MIASTNKYILTSLLLVVVLFPSVSRAFISWSLAPGVLIVSVLSILILMFAQLQRRIILRSTIASLIIGLFLFVLVHATISIAIHDVFDIVRFAQSYLFLMVFLGGAFAFILWIKIFLESRVNFALWFIFYILMISGAMALFGISPFFSTSIPVVFFSENSHYALQLSPFLLYTFINAKSGKKYYWLFFATILSILLKSITLMAIVLLIFMILFDLRKLWLTLLFLIFLALLLSFGADLDYFISRISLTPESDNISVLALLQGFERAYLNMKETHGLGVGFQQFGLVGSKGEITIMMESLGAGDLNLLDGTTVGAKLVGEFGIFGLLFVGIYLFYFVKKVRWIRQVLNGGITASKMDIFFTCCFVLFIVEIFIRGTGYFSNTGFMFCASIFWFTKAGRLHLARKCI